VFTLGVSFLGGFAIHERVLGADHPYVAVSLHNLAKTLRELGDPAAARPPAERAVAVDERTYGPDHPEVATDLDVLADILRDLDDHEAAQRCRARATAIRAARPRGGDGG